MARVEYRQTFHRSAQTDDALLAPAPRLPDSGHQSLPAHSDLPEQSTHVAGLLGNIIRAFSSRSSLPSSLDEQVAQTAFSITAIFESGGRLDALQTKDSGIISYGRHQATLASGALTKVIEHFCRLSESQSASKFSDYTKRLSQSDVSLRHDSDFLKLLRNAAKEDPATMRRAQDAIFVSSYWKPAVALTAACGFSSPLAKAIFFDTKVQGGCETVLRRTVLQITKTLIGEKKLESGSGIDTSTTKKAALSLATLLSSGLVSEQQVLRIFIEERKGYVLGVAASKKKAGDALTAKALVASTRYRAPAFLSLLDQRNLALRGQLLIHDTRIEGLPQ